MPQIGRKLTPEGAERLRQIIADREAEDAPTYKEIAKKYGISPSKLGQLYRYAVYLRQQGKLVDRVAPPEAERFPEPVPDAREGRERRSF